MKYIKPKILFCVCFISLFLNSCNSSDDTNYIAPNLANFPTTGLLGQSLSINVEHLQVGKLQVFFDLEEADINYVSDNEIKVIVPRTITRHNPTLKVIDLNENKTILNVTFFLKTPVITGYDNDQITFNQTLTINGENFDTLKDYVSVLINDKNAIVSSVTYNKIEVQIPNEISVSQLEVKVRAQHQEVTSSQSLQLKNPLITSIQNNVAWINNQLIVSGINLNPNHEYGQTFINGIQCLFTVYNNQLSITIPPGPFHDFKITNVTYSTAGLTSSYDCSIPIQNDAILVDHVDNAHLNHTIFEHNGKAYQFISRGNIGSIQTYSLLEFSPITEKWTELSSFSYTGNLYDIVYDGNNFVYLYKYVESTNSFALSKMNMNTFYEVDIELPYNKIIYPIIFAFQDNLYIISGLNNNNGNITVRDQKYKYSSLTNTWTQLSSDTLSELPLVSSQGTGKCHYLISGNAIYITYGINNITYKINSNLSVQTYTPTFCFKYSNAIIGKPTNLNQYFYNIITGASVQLSNNNLLDYGNMFFTLNNEIYFIKNSWTFYYPNSLYTQKLRKQLIYGIL